MQLIAALVGVLLILPVAYADFVPGNGEGLQELSDNNLADVAGRDGVALDLEFRLNADAAGDPLGCDVASVSDPCRLAVQFANRTGEWLVVKGLYGSLKVNGLQLDAFLSPLDPDNAVYSQFDATRFRAGASSSCILSGNASNDCAKSDLTNMPMLQLGFRDVDGAHKEADVMLGYTMGGIAVEYDAAPVVGYDRNTNGSFISLRAKDMVGGPAIFDIDGVLHMFGF